MAGALESLRENDARDPLIYDWNGEAPGPRVPKVLDETLRDGIQSASVRDPSISDKVSLLHAMVGLGIDAATIGMPSSRPKQREDVLRLAREIATQKLPIDPSCPARTLVEDVVPIVEISQKAGLSVEVAVFVGSSPIRQHVDGRSLAELQSLTETAIGFAVDHRLPVMFITEDTTRSTPDVLRALYTTAIRAGARRLCVADTVGHASPRGAARLVACVSEIALGVDPAVRIDWHGHRDRGMAVSNSVAAWAAGAERCHGTALGVGERSGNTPMELLLVNLRLLGWSHRNLRTLPAYAALASRALGVKIPPNTPVVGSDPFRTATGVHASVLGRAATMGDQIRDDVYCSVRAGVVGRSQQIAIGPMSGRANVRQFFQDRGMATPESLVDAVLQRAKGSDAVLSENEVLAIASAVRRSRVELQRKAV